ncbi:uncharacterized protein LOC126902338 isoform X2 [Daktulosphaira vitifoliae]|uniref:uncharacterized protein LOC126902338 isoform X2 n=1 Tax=Daktulosphaira vitifoliae TaxID=58002 RepID=UPI0021A9FC47|nr:uncharacterized protein LOC126902338 isoform X2 [Daktulosphaira vitifoliae]
MKFFSLVSLSTMVFMVIHNDHYLTKCIATSGVPESSGGANKCVPESLGDANKQDESSDGADQQKGKYTPPKCGSCGETVNESQRKNFSCGHLLCKSCVNISLEKYKENCLLCQENKNKNNDISKESFGNNSNYLYGCAVHDEFAYAIVKKFEPLFSSNSSDREHSYIRELKKRFSNK